MALVEVAAFWGFQVDVFFKFPIQEGLFDVYLVAFEVESIDNGQKDPKRVLVCDRGEKLVVVQPRDLLEALATHLALNLSGRPVLPLTLRVNTHLAVRTRLGD